MVRQLSEQMARTLGIFQAIIAVPFTLFFGVAVFEDVVSGGYWIPLLNYHFIKSTILSLTTAGIIFTVLVQRNPNIDRRTNLYFEIAKSVLATATWVWLLCDALFASVENEYYNKPEFRKARVARISIAVIFLVVIYYPTLWLAIYTRLTDGPAATTEERVEAADEEAEVGEREPLLGNRASSSR